MAKPSQSLNKRIKTLEKQIMLRHRNVRTVVTGFTHKTITRMVSPVSLLAALGIGVVIEQTNRDRGWSLATVIDAASASIGLLLSFTSAVQLVRENSTQESTHDFTEP